MTDQVSVDPADPDEQLASLLRESWSAFRNVADPFTALAVSVIEAGWRPVSPSPAGLDEQRDTLMRLIAPVMGAWTIDSPYLDRAPREVADAVIAAGWRPVSRNGAGR